MNLKAIEKLMAMLPEGAKKEAFKQKLNQLQSKAKSAGKSGLQDEYMLKPTGHIMIEEINKDGQVVGVLADQPNIVVNGAEEILLRAFSGDPDRLLYKIRVPKKATTAVQYIELGAKDPLIDVVGAENVLVYHPNKIWNVVDEDEFDVEYSFYPNTVYIEETTPSVVEPNKKAFVITKKATANSAPLTAEVYSTFTNLFIGLGDGKNFEVKLDDARLTYSPGFTGDASRKETSTLTDEIKFTQKITNFVVELEKSNKGGQFEVYVNGILKSTVETLNSGLSDGQTEKGTYTLDKLDSEAASEVKLKFSGSDGITGPKIAITGIRFDSFSKTDRKLIKEFDNFTKSFDTPAFFNTTNVAPYTVKLDHFPVVDGSVVVEYNGTKYTTVESLSELGSGKFFVDAKHGQLLFDRALTNLSIAYAVTGEIFADEHVPSLVSTTLNNPIAVTDEIPAGLVNGSNKTFTVAQKPLDPAGIVTVTLDGNPLPASGFTRNNSTGVITLASSQAAPASNVVVKVSYVYLESKTGRKFTVQHPIKVDSMKIVNGEGSVLTEAKTIAEFQDGKFMIDTTDLNKKTVIISDKNVTGTALGSIEIIYLSDERPGVPTNYKRQVILKPKEANLYPWYALDKGTISFVAEFEEKAPSLPVTIREMGLFSGPRVDDGIRGFKNYPVEAFSLVRVGETKKDTSTGLRVTWTITLLNDAGAPFKGGNN